MQFTNAAGLKLECEELSREDGSLLLNILSMQYEDSGINTDEVAALFTSKVIDGRIKAFNLPIKFTPAGYLLAGLFSRGSPGKVVTILVDALNKFEGKTIGHDEMIDLYPFGFYTEDAFTSYVDDHLKKRAVKWAEIY